MRTVNQIFQEIVATKQQHQALDRLTNTSATSIWRLIAYVVASAHWALEWTWEQLKVEINSLIAVNRIGTREWYFSTIRRFQAGSQFTINDGAISYETVDEQSQIIKKIAYSRGENGELLFKVAKEENDTLVALSDEERDEFQRYLSAISLLGTKTVAVSLPADRIAFTAGIYKNPFYSDELVYTQLKQAINDFASTNNDEGILNKNALQKKILELDEVEDMDQVALFIKDELGAETEVIREVVLPAGYAYLSEDVDDQLENLVSIYAE